MIQENAVSVSQVYLNALEKKVEDLNLLVEVSSIISSTLDFDVLITLVMEKAKEVMDAEASSILLYKKEINKLEFAVALGEKSTSDTLKEKVTLDMGQGIAGWVAEHRETIVIEDAKNDERFFKGADKLSGFQTKSLIATPLLGRSGLIGVAEVLNPRNKKEFNQYDAEIFVFLCRQVSVAIENSSFHKTCLAAEKAKRELEIAAVVQKSFLPASPSLQRGMLNVSAMNISALEVGGDIYDFVEYENGKVGVLIGDVSGKGVHAALYMAKILSEFRYLARLSDKPGEILDRLNDNLSASPRGMFLTCIYLIADPDTGCMEVSVAGHPFPLKISPDNVEVVSLPTGPPLGILSAEFPDSRISLDQGERLVLVTDGAFDAKNTEGERIGFDALVEYLKEHVTQGLKEDSMIQLIADHVADFSKGMGRADDLTLLEIKYGMGGKPELSKMELP